MNRIAILVLGMHRSGTSALTWLIGRLGAKLPADAIEPTPENPRGYWESTGLIAVDNQLLRTARSSWFDPRALDLSRLAPDALPNLRSLMREAVGRAFGNAPLFVVKDPRQCRFVPVVAQALTEMDATPRAVLMLRSSAEIAASLASRDGTSPAYAHLLCLRHMIDAELGSRGMPRVVVDYDSMLADWRETARKLSPLLGLDEPSLDGEVAAEIDGFIDPSLRHHKLGREVLEEPLASLVAKIEDGQRALVAADNDETRARLDQVYSRFNALSWLEGDIVHDELRHRRMPSSRPAPAEPQPEPEPAPEPVVEAPRAAQPAPPPPTDLVADAELIREFGLLDADWYRAEYDDIPADMDPIEHYLTIGAAEGRNPNPLFDTGYYARQMARRLAGQRNLM